MRYATEREELRHEAENGLPPEEVADRTFKAIREEKPYVFAPPGVNEAWERRVRSILEGLDPRNEPGHIEPNV